MRSRVLQFDLVSVVIVKVTRLCHMRSSGTEIRAAAPKE